jgi:Flp pilus assembly protein TadD
MKPSRADARVQAALAFEAAGQSEQAERAYRAALQVAPRHLTALNNLGFLYAERGRFDEAAPLFRRAAFAHPSDPAALINLAGVLRELGDEAGAVDGFERVIALDPGSRLGRLNLANLLRSMGRLEQARPHYQLMLKQDPHDGLARWNLAALEGLAGNLDAAFAGFALHHGLEPAAPPPRLPRWDGGLLDGRTILLEAYQGLGDTLMFARFARRVADLGGRVILRAQPELEGLLSAIAGVQAYAPLGGPRPAADVWFPLVDLPALPGMLADFCAETYLPPPAGAAGAPADSGAAMRVGLVWAGNPAHPDDRNRSAPLSVLLAALGDIPGLELVSLQKGARAAEAEGAPIRTDLTLDSFVDTARAIQRLDLVISVDTSVLHLAGAMGRPVWALLPVAPDWRWMLDRTDSPWYPSLTLYRQSRARDWAGVAERVAADLRRGLVLTGDRC